MSHAPIEYRMAKNHQAELQQIRKLDRISERAEEKPPKNRRSQIEAVLVALTALVHKCL